MIITKIIWNILSYSHVRCSCQNSKWVFGLMKDNTRHIYTIEFIIFITLKDIYKDIYIVGNTKGFKTQRITVEIRQVTNIT